MASGIVSWTLNSKVVTVAQARKIALSMPQGKDVERIVSYWSDDAVVIPQGQPIVEGKAAIRAFVRSSLQIPGFKIHWVSEKPTFSPDGKLAYMRGTNTMTVPGANGGLVTLV